MKKFINMVKERPFLYDNRNIDFNHREKKLEGWNEIAQIMGKETGNFWRYKWNCLKENYAKYKKVHFNPSHPTYRKYRNWPWAEHMKFIDDCPNKRNFKNNKKLKIEKCLESVHNDIIITKINEMENDSHTEFNNVELSEFLDMGKANEITIDNKGYMDAKTYSPEQNMDHHVNDIQIVFQKDIEHTASSKNKNVIPEKKTKKNEFDEVEHFFMSYAQTFKRLPARFQQVVKLEMVTLFARYELQAQIYDENM